MPTASIIIPIYNAEKYISRCLDSIIKQTFTDIEVICVNDGSKDSSYEILLDYCRKYPDIIKLYRQVNSGTGKTRNNGISYASGKYLFFIDNDDYIREDYIETFVKTAESNGADMVIGGYRRVDDNGKTIYSDKPSSDPVWAPFKRIAPWGRVYRRAFIQENSLQFLDNKAGEDFYLNVIAAVKSENTKIIEYNGYFWVYNRHSITNTQHLDPKLNELTLSLLSDVFHALDFSSISVLKRDCMEYLFIKFLVFHMLFIGRKKPANQIMKEYEELFKALRSYFPNYRHNSLLGFFKPKGETVKVRLIVYSFILLQLFGLVKVFLRIYSHI